MHVEKPKVLILLDRLVIGGQAVDVIPLCFYLQQHFQVQLAYGHKKSEDTDAHFLLNHYQGLQVIQLKHLRKTFNPIINCLSFFEIKQLIKTLKPQIIHTNAVKCGIFGRFAAKQLKVPIIIHTFHGHFFHSYFNKFFSQFIITIEKKLAAFTNSIVATSTAQAVDLVQQYQITSQEKVTVITLGLDDTFLQTQQILQNESFKETYAIQPNTICIGIIARIVKVKNFHLFVEVVRKVIGATNKNILFFVIGDGGMKNTIQQQLTNNQISWCEKHNFSSNAKVIFTSWMPYVSVALQNLDIVILTSHNEGTGLSLAESQFFGKPVVATKVGGIPDTVIHEQTGFLVPDNDADMFSEKLLLLINDDALRTKMGKAAQLFAQEKFSKKNEVAQFIQLYQKLLSKT